MVDTGHFYFDPEDKIYLEHFPGNPVVPGTLIIKAFMDLIDESNLMIENFTYKKFLRPGRCSYLMEKKDNSYNCKIYDGKKTIAKGFIKTGESL